MVHGPLDGRPRLERRRFLKQAAAAGLSASTRAWPAQAQDKAAASGTQPILADTLARYAARPQTRGHPRGRGPARQAQHPRHDRLRVRRLRSCT